jgi:hypothetical protein
VSARVIAESSPQRHRWDQLVLLCVLLSCVLVPLQLAFVREPSTAAIALGLLLDVVFFADIAFNFRTSYREAGIEITDPDTVKKRYLRGLFALDLAANAPIDLLLIASPDSHVAGLSLLFLLRLNRLLRLARLFVIFQRWERLPRIRSGYVRIAKFFVTILVLIHWVACAWFLVPYVEGFPTDSWVAKQALESADGTTQYIRSLYWAVVTMTTVGYGDITPGRNVEYVFTIGVMMLGASMYAFIIGNLASLFSSIDATRTRFFARVDAADEYLRARDVSPQLNDRVRRYYEYLWDRHRGVQKDMLFADLPAPVRLQVLLQLERELLEEVPLFRACGSTLKHALLMALKPQVLAPGVTIIHEGEPPTHAYFLSNGRAAITSAGGEEHHGHFETGDSFGIVSMVLREPRTATVRTEGYCDVLVLSRDDFERLKNEYPEFKDVLKKVSSEKSERMSALFLDGVVL